MFLAVFKYVITRSFSALTKKHNRLKLWHNVLTTTYNAFTTHWQPVATHFRGVTHLHWLISPQSFHSNSLLQLILHSFFQNCGQYLSLGCDKDACDSYHRVTRLTEKGTIEFLLDNYLERNNNKLLKMRSPKLPLMFLCHKINMEKFLYLLFNSQWKQPSVFSPSPSGVLRGCLRLLPKIPYWWRKSVPHLFMSTDWFDW